MHLAVYRARQKSIFVFLHTFATSNQISSADKEDFTQTAEIHCVGAYQPLVAL